MAGSISTSTNTERVDTIMDGINQALDEFKGCLYNHLSNDELFPKSTRDAKRPCCPHKDVLANFQDEFVNVAANCNKKVSIAKKELKKIGRKMQELEVEKGEQDDETRLAMELSLTCFASSPNKINGKKVEVQVQSPVSILKEEEAQGVLRKFMKEEIYDDLIDEFICSFCNEIFLPPTVSAPCGHTYCDLCIMKWVKEKRTCPMCVNPLTEKDLRRNYYIEGVVEGLKAKVSSAKRSELATAETERRQERQKVKTILNLDENKAPRMAMAQPQRLPQNNGYQAVTVLQLPQSQGPCRSLGYNNQNRPRTQATGNNGDPTTVEFEIQNIGNRCQNHVGGPSNRNQQNGNANANTTPVLPANNNGQCSAI